MARQGGSTITADSVWRMGLTTDLPQGMGRGVLMPAANRHQIRDGPIRYRQRFSGLLRHDTREAA
jgi:hypothetical protein